MTEIITKSISAVKWHALYRVASQVFMWAVSIFVIRLLDPKDYGLMGMAMILIGLLELFNNIGLGAAIVQRDCKTFDKRELSSTFWIGLTVAGFIYLFLYLAAPIVSGFFGEPKLIPIIRVIGIAFLFGGIRLVPYNLMTKNLQFRKRGFADFMGNISSSLVCLGFAYHGFGVWSLVAGHLAKEAVILLVVFFYSPFRPQLVFQPGGIRDLFLFGGQITLSRVLWYTYSNLDYLIVGRLMGKVLLGYYSVAFQLASLPINKLNLIIREVAFPSYSAIQSNPLEIRYYFMKNIRMLATFLFPVLVGMILVADDIFVVIIGEKWLRSRFIFQVLCASSVLKSVISQHAPMLNATGKVKYNIRQLIIQILVMPVAFYLAAPYGIEGVALCWAAVYPLNAQYVIFITLRELNIRYSEYLRCLLPPIVCCLLMCFPVLGFQLLIKELWLRLFGACALGIIAYPAFMALLFKKDFDECRMLFNKFLPARLAFKQN